MLFINLEGNMQKRDKLGRFLKNKVSKKKAKIAKKSPMKLAVKPKKLAVYVTKKSRLVPKVRDLSMFDLQDMIQAEVCFQMSQVW